MAEQSAASMPSWQRHVRRVFLLQLALVCAVAAIALAVLAVHGSTPPSWLAPAVFVAAAVAMLAIAWFGDRAARRAIAPVCWILREVGRWDPRCPQPQALAPEQRPAGVSGEVGKLADALYGFGQRLEQHAARERDFTRAASHELRTPLTVIRVASDLIDNDEGLSEPARRSLQRIRAASASMESVIDALLLLARGECAAMDAEDFDVAELLAGEVERVRPLVEDKGLVLRVEQGATPTLEAPRRALQVVLANLLDNAVRFTRAGEIHIRLLEDRIDIIDSGIGMDVDTLGHAREPFYRADVAGPGAGLGLAVAHRLAERCGWTLDLASTMGAGTRARVVFAAGGRD